MGRLYDSPFIKHHRNYIVLYRRYINPGQARQKTENFARPQIFYSPGAPGEDSGPGPVRLSSFYLIFIYLLIVILLLRLLIF